MKTYLSALCSWCGIFLLGSIPLVAQASPAPLPAEVKASVPRGAVSFLTKRLPIGFRGTTRLVHIWGAVRPNPSDSLNSYNRYAPSPFCVDVFEPSLDKSKKWRWHLVSAASYVDVASPTQILGHWLRPATKQGPTLEIISSNGAPGVSTTHTILTWDEGLREGYDAPTPQKFGSGGTGGGRLEQLFDGVDKKGFMTVTTKDWYGDTLNSTTIYHWDGARFVASPNLK